MNNIALELEALTKKAPAALNARVDAQVLVWALENIGNLPEQTTERETKLELLGREVCIKRIELLESETDISFVGKGCVSQLEETLKTRSNI